jgi:hypothetical protein
LGSGYSTDLLIFFRSGFYKSEKPPVQPSDFGVVFQKWQWDSNMLEVAAWSGVRGAMVVPRWAKSRRRFCHVFRFFSFYMFGC